MQMKTCKSKIQKTKHVRESTKRDKTFLYKI